MRRATTAGAENASVQATSLGGDISVTPLSQRAASTCRLPKWNTHSRPYRSLLDLPSHCRGFRFIGIASFLEFRHICPPLHLMESP